MSNENRELLPYYAVIFSSTMSQDQKGYEEMSKRMVELAQQQEGFIDYESAKETIGITISYWKSLESIANWKKNIEHLQAQKQGINQWYQSYKIRICKVEREYAFEKKN